MKQKLQKTIFRILLLLLVPVSVQAQTGIISGNITDDSGEPLIGVNVVIKGTTNGTVSDFDGNYTLTNLPLESLTIEVSFIGYITKTYVADLSKQQNVHKNIVLSEDVKEISEVVVIGYGTQKKSDLTSAVSSVSSEDLEEARAANIQEALQGRASGVQISANTGAPGSDVSVKIRGVTSINGTDPLWIIDGVPGDPNSVSASDIQSMEILKDASSAAIYGANAGSGVILVTTKKGKAGETKVTFNSYVGKQVVTNSIDLTSGPEFAQMYHEYETLAKKRDYFSTEPDTFKTYNYQDMIFREALMQNYDLGVSGGNEQSTFYMGVSYTEQEGILQGTDYNKLTARLNGEHQANKWVTFGFNTSYARREYNGFEEWELQDDYASPILNSITYHAFMNPYGEKTTDSEYDDGWSYSPLGNVSNPIAMIGLKHRQSVQQDASGTFYTKISPFKGLTYESRLNGKTSFAQVNDFSPIYFITASNSNDKSTIYKENNSMRSWNFQNLITYNTTLFDVHNISVLAGMESGYSKTEWSDVTSQSLLNQTEEMWYADAGSEFLNPSNTAEESAGYSYLSRLSYDYKGMVLAQANVRKDYSSIFGPKYRSGVFPSASLGFKFTELDIVKNTLPFMNFGKIRYGWGKVGNNSVAPYQYYSTVVNTEVFAYGFNNTTAESGVSPNGLPNESIRWEEVVTSNFGFDFGFLSNKLTTTIDYFERHNVGMLMEVEEPFVGGNIVEYPDQEGGRSYSDYNVGEFNNNGIELGLGWKEQRGNVKYGANMNFTYTKTMVGDIRPDTLYQGNAKGFGVPLTRTVENQPFDIFYGYVTDGLFRLSDNPNEDGICTNQPYTLSPDGDTLYAQPKAKPGDFKFKDVNGDGKINEEDMVALGSPHPKFTCALNMYADIKLPNNLGNVDVKAFFQGAFGHKVFNATKFYLFNTDGAFNWSKDYYDNHYTVELYDRNDVLVTEANDNAKYPRIDPTSQNENFTRISDFYVEDASYVRLKNIELGYTLPATTTKKIEIERLRIYAAVKNVFTITKYSGLDPEVGGSRNENGKSDPRTTGIDKGAYPTARMYTLGINVTF